MVTNHCKKSKKSPLLKDRYQIICTIKSGGMGCVYRALDTRLNTVVALKKMMPAAAHARDMAYIERRFHEEAQILSRLHHGGLPAVIDCFIIEEPDSGSKAHYLAMTFIEGKDLETIMAERSNTALAAGEVHNYMMQILAILSYLHTQKPGIVYRDLKPSNIMIHNEQVFLVDFGIARLYRPHEQGTLIGTPGYAAPEQYKGFAEPRSDLYALGVIAHHLLTGIDPADPARPPFSFELIRKINPDVPENLARVVASMLELIPENRPDSAEEVIAMLTAGEVVKAIARRTSIISYEKLLRAIERNDISMVKEFIKKGAPLNDTNAYIGETLLHVAARGDNLEMAELLIGEGASVAMEDDFGLTPLHRAAREGSLEIVKLLLAYNADVKIDNNEERLTPLHCAAIGGNRLIADFLIEKGAEVNARGKRGELPLHWAAYYGHEALAELLIQKGSELNTEDENGNTPYSWATKEQGTAIMELFKRYGARKTNIFRFLGLAFEDVISQGRQRLSKIPALLKSNRKLKQCINFLALSVNKKS